MKEKLFSYGTLRRQAVQLKLFGRVLDGIEDALEGYRLASIEIEDEAFLSKGEDKFQLTLVRSEKPTDAVEGTVFEISGEELFRADDYEPANYRRIKLALRSGKQAWIYLAAETIK